MKSLLEVADLDPATLSSALRAGADALIVSSAGAARTGEPTRLFVRIDDIDDEPLDAAVAAGVHAALLVRTSSVAAVERLAALLAVAEARAGLADGAVRIIVSIGSGAGLLALPDLGRAHARVAALAWDAGALAADLGATSAREADGAWIEPLAHARTRLLAAAAAAGLPAIDTRSHQGPAAFRAEAEAAKWHGFRAKIARTPAQAAALTVIHGPQTEGGFAARRRRR